MKLASEYANKAVSLDNYLAAGHVSLGMAKMSDGDSTEAEKQFRTAADLDRGWSMSFVGSVSRRSPRFWLRSKLGRI